MIFLQINTLGILTETCMTEISSSKKALLV